MVADAIVAIVADEVLPSILTLVHRSGLGHTARVIRPARSPIREQLRRTGVPISAMPERIDDAPAVLMIMAAARSPFAADLAHQNGASATWIVTTKGVWNLIDDHLVETPEEPATVEAPAAPVIPATPDVSVPANG